MNEYKIDSSVPGVMGRGIINNLLQANYEVVVFNRTKAHAQSVLDNGATWADSPKEIAEAADLVITMVGYPKDVEEQYYGDNGLFAGSHAGQIFVDMTTSTPTLAEQCNWPLMVRSMMLMYLMPRFLVVMLVLRMVR